MSIPSTILCRHSQLEGIGYYLLGLACIGLFDACAKGLVNDYPVPQVIFLEATIGLMFGSGVALTQGVYTFRSRHLNLQVLRGVLTAGLAYCFFYGLRFLPLADLTAAVSSAPLFMVLLAPLLGERVTTGVKLTVCVGFLGVLLILQPSASVQWALLLPLGGAICYALIAIVSRMIEEDHPWTTVAYTNVVIMALSAPALPSSWMPIVPADWSLIVLMSAMGTAGVYYRVKAAVYAPVAILAPFDYTHIVWAVIFGFIIWGEFPAPPVWAGIATIVLSGLYILQSSREKASNQPE